MTYKGKTLEELNEIEEDLLEEIRLVKVAKANLIEFPSDRVIFYVGTSKFTNLDMITRLMKRSKKYWLAGGGTGIQALKDAITFPEGYENPKSALSREDVIEKTSLAEFTVFFIFSKELSKQGEELKSKIRNNAKVLNLKQS